MTSERPVLTLDIDGVIAGGEYIPEWDRRPEVYDRLPLLEPGVPEYLRELCLGWHVYLVSGRRYPGALQSTRKWVRSALDGIPFAGTIVRAHPAYDKATLCGMLGSYVHVDDCPEIVTLLESGIPEFPHVGILKCNLDLRDQWPGIGELIEKRGGYDCVETWEELMGRLEFYRNEWRQQSLI